MITDKTGVLFSINSAF